MPDSACASYRSFVQLASAQAALLADINIQRGCFSDLFAPVLLARLRPCLDLPPSTRIQSWSAAPPHLGLVCLTLKKGLVSWLLGA